MMCDWGGYNKDEVIIDAPSSLVLGTPDANVMRELATGVGNSVYPLTITHRYLVSSGLLDQTVSFEEYVSLLEEDQKIKNYLSGMAIGAELDSTVNGVNYGSGDAYGNQDFRNRFDGKFKGDNYKTPENSGFESADRYANYDKNGSRKRRRKGGLVSDRTRKAVEGTQNDNN